MVREHIDTLDSLLARYVAGNLPVPARVLVESHMEMRPQSRAFVADLEQMAGDALADLPPSAVGLRDAALERIFASSSDAVGPDSRRMESATHGLPSALRDLVGFDIDAVPWRIKLPGFREYEIGEIDGCHASMFWLRPRRRVPAHTHHGCEITLVLQGAFSDGIGRYGPGDISVADEDIDHRPIAEHHQPCIGFAVTDAPLRLTGSFRQLIGDLIR